MTDFDLYNYELIACQPDENRTQIAYIRYSALEYSPRFKDIAQLKFTVDYLEPLPTGSIINPDFEKVIGSYLVLMNIKINNDIIESRYFYIANPSLSGVDKDKKELTCFSLEYKLAKRKLRGYKQVSYLYDNIGSNGLLNYMISQLYGMWTIGTIDSSLLGQQRSFNYASTSYIEVIRDIERIFSCVCDFDTINMKINITLIENYGKDSDLFISQDNYMAQLSKSEKHDQIITKLYVYGSNNLSIIDKNITGQSYLLDMSYYRTLEYMESSLLTAWNNYDTLIESKKGIFSGYLSQLSTLNTSLLTKQSELSNLKVTLLQYQDNMNICIKEGSASGYNYSYWYNMYIAQQSVINSKNTEINNVQNAINAINSDIQILNQQVILENNFTTNQLKVISEYIFEDEMTISEISDSQTLYNEALYQLNKRKIPMIDFNINLVDLLSISKAKNDWKKIKIGDYINIDYKRYGIDCMSVRLIEYTHDPLNHKLSFNFNNQDEYNEDYYYNSRIAQQSKQTSDIITVERPNYNLYVDDKGNILYNGQIISSVNNPITLPDGTIIGDNGFVMSDDPTANNQMRILGDRILFTQDNWATVSVGINASGIHSILVEGCTINGGTINVWTDINVGDNINIGNQTALVSKSINFYNNGSQHTNITATTGGGLQLNAFSNIWLTTGGDISLVSQTGQLNLGNYSGGGTDSEFIGNLHFSAGTVYFDSDVSVSGLITNTTGYHNHGIGANTRLAIVDAMNNVIGGVFWTPSGDHSHDIIVQ